LKQIDRRFLQGAGQSTAEKLDPTPIFTMLDKNDVGVFT
jgi:hypothetical protein